MHPVGWIRAAAGHIERFGHVRFRPAAKPGHLGDCRTHLAICSFDRGPNVVRLHGRGRVVSRYDAEFEAWAGRFDPNPHARAVIVVDVERVSDSCGYSLPLMSLDEERDLLTPNMERRGADGVVAYRVQKNRTSIDGLPAFKAGE